MSSYESELDEADRIIGKQNKEIARLQAIVDKLPKTKDGVSIVPGIFPVFRKMHIGHGRYEVEARWDTAKHLIEASYSTSDAAEAAGGK